MSAVAERYRKWFTYEQDAHAKVVRALETVPDASRAAPEYQKALALLGHIAAARSLWLFRMGAAATGPTTAEELFPTGQDLKAVRGALDAMHGAWSAYLGKLDDEALARIFRYRATEGDTFENTVEDLLTQLYGHSCYHRGQIASLVRALGKEPAVTDYVFWTRRNLDSGERGGEG